MGKEGVKVSLTLGRRLLGVVLTAYTPTVLLNVIGHNANYFKSFFFEAVVTVNLTAMLVLATMFISIAESLPKTAYLKMMDYWLVFNLILPFVEVLLHTYMEKLTKEDEVHLTIDPNKIKVRSYYHLILQLNFLIHKDSEYLRTVTEKQKERKAVLERKKKRRVFCKKMTLVYIPIGALTFVGIYWAVGLKNAQFY